MIFDCFEFNSLFLLIMLRTNIFFSIILYDPVISDISFGTAIYISERKEAGFIKYAYIFLHP